MNRARAAQPKLLTVALTLGTAVAAGCGPQTAPGDAPTQVTRAALSAQPLNASFGQPSSAQCQPSHLTLHGYQPMRGPTPGSPVQIVPVLWGTSGFGFTTLQEDTFLSNAFSSPWWSWIRRQSHLSSVTMAATKPLQITTGNTGKTVLKDEDIQAEILAHLKDSTLPLYGGGGSVGGMLYVIHLPPGVYAEPDSFSGGTTQLCGGSDGKQFDTNLYTAPPCAYNATPLNVTWTDGTPITYAVVPDLTRGSCATTCQVTGVSGFGLETLAESHELIEAMTDPWLQQPGVGSTHGWYDTHGCGQIGDMCNAFPVTTTGNTVVQMIWSNSANRCAGNSPGALGDIGNLGTAAILLSGDTNPGAETKVHIAQAPIPSSPGTTALAPSDLVLALTGASGWLTSEKTGKPVVGDFTGDGITDLALTATSWPDLPSTVMPVLRSDGVGDLTRPGGGLDPGTGAPANLRPKIRSTAPPAVFTDLATQTKIPPVTGDFNGDGFADIALIGGPGWSTIPLALSTHDGIGQFWSIVDEFDSGFNSYITNNATGNPQLVAADFNGDGLTNLALVGLTASPGVGRDFIGLALAHPDSKSNYSGDATFVVRSWQMTGPAGGAATDFNTWASSPGVKAVAGDFDGDGFGDIALAGGTLTSIPIAFSRGAVDGPTTFAVVNANTTDNAAFAAMASKPGAQLLAGDFDGNGTWDLAVTGASSFTGVGLAMNAEVPASPGSMTFVSDTANLSTFAQMAGRVNVLATAPSHGGSLDFVIPPPPTGLTAAAGTGVMNLSWTPSGGALTYTLFRATVAGGEAPIASGLTTTSFVDSGLPNGAKFFYKVGAVNLAGTSNLSSEISNTTLPRSINCGGAATGSWLADTNTTGSPRSWTNSVNTSLLTATIPPPAVLQTGRIGNLTYDLTGLLPSSSHTLTLYFVENYWGTSGSRVFTVKANGASITGLTNFDIYAAANSKFKAVQRQFSATADSTGKIRLTFVPSKDNASVEGIALH